MNPLRQILLLGIFASIYSQTMMASEAGSMAPSCQLSAFENDQHIDTSELRGKIVYLDFWASWCPPCVKSFPFMNKMHQALRNKGVEILGVNLDENLTDTQEFLAKFPAQFKVMLDPDQRCAKSFDVKAMPSSYLVDRHGVVRHVHLGFRSGDAEALQAVIEQLINEDLVSN